MKPAFLAWARAGATRRETAACTSTAGATLGSIMASIITTHISESMVKSAPSCSIASIAGMAGMPAWCTRYAQARSATAASAATSSARSPSGSGAVSAVSKLAHRPGRGEAVLHQVRVALRELQVDGAALAAGGAARHFGEVEFLAHRQVDASAVVGAGHRVLDRLDRGLDHAGYRELRAPPVEVELEGDALEERRLHGG